MALPPSSKDTHNGSKSPLNALPEWDLSDLYESHEAPALETDKAQFTTLCAAFAKRYETKIANLDKAGLLEMLHAYEEIARLETRLSSYASLLSAQDRNDAIYAKFQSDIRTHLITQSASLVFLSLEINAIPETRLENFLADSPELAHYKMLFMLIRASKPYQLSEELERFIHDKSVAGTPDWIELFDETLAGLRCDVDGEALSVEATLNLLTEKDRTTREKGARALARVLKQNESLFARIHNTLAKEKEITDRWRGIENPALSRHLSNQIEPETVEALRDAVVASYSSLSHRYYALKARWLGLERMEIWDRNAPLTAEDTRLYPWEDACNLVLGAYRAFDPRMADIGELFFQNAWIDAPERAGKALGAFSHPTSTDAHPYILLNYLGKPRDVMTLAHELGHGIHQVLAARQGPLMASTPLTLAETASVFGEMLTFRTLLSQAKDKETKRAVLAGKVEDMINTLVRQIAFYEFETRLHKARTKGKLTPADINSLWMDVQHESLGPVFDYMDGYENFWSYIPHFIHSPFYVYAYAFGDGLANALYGAYEAGIEGFEDKYLDLLKAGGTRSYGTLLEPFGLDARNPDFWNIGLNMISGMIDQLEAMDPVKT